MAFHEGIKSRKVLPDDFDSRRAQLACSRILRTADRSSIALSNVYEIPKFWINLDGLRNSSNLNIIESCITRAYCMQGSLNFHLWLIDIVQGAVEKSALRHTWIQKLAWEVEMAVNQSQTVAFASKEYLPELLFPETYTFNPKPFRFDQKELVCTTLSSILRLWLHFPSDQLSLLQLSLIQIVVSKSPSSVLFLDKVWEMYNTPFSTVFNVWNSRSSKKNLDNSLAKIRQDYNSHPYATAASLEYQKLEYLSKLFSDWMGMNGLDSDMPVPTMVSQCSLSLNNFVLICYDRSRTQTSRSWTSYRSRL